MMKRQGQRYEKNTLYVTTLYMIQQDIVVDVNYKRVVTNKIYESMFSKKIWSWSLAIRTIRVIIGLAM